MPSRIVAAVLLYAIGAFLTGGYYVNHRCDGNGPCGMQSITTGIGWPLYWAGRYAIEVTK